MVVMPSTPTPQTSCIVMHANGRRHLITVGRHLNQLYQAFYQHNAKAESCILVPVSLPPTPQRPKGYVLLLLLDAAAYRNTLASRRTFAPRDPFLDPQPRLGLNMFTSGLDFCQAFGTFLVVGTTASPHVIPYLNTQTACRAVQCLPHDISRQLARFL